MPETTVMTVQEFEKSEASGFFDCYAQYVYEQY